MAQPLPAIGSPGWGPVLNAALAELQADAFTLGGPMRKAMSLAQSMMGGGGTLFFNGTGFKWSAPLYSISMGRGPHWTIGSTVEVAMPPNGTVIPGYAGANPKTVAGGLIPFGIWECLYYELTPGTDLGTSDPSKFRIVAFGSNAQVPDNWLLVASINSSANTMRVVNGATLVTNRPWSADRPWGETGWRDVTPLNGWTFAFLRIQRAGSEVTFSIEQMNPATNTNITFCTIPAGFRPSASDSVVRGSVHSAAVVPAFRRVGVNPTGEAQASIEFVDNFYGDIKWTTSDDWPTP